MFIQLKPAIANVNPPYLTVTSVPENRAIIAHKTKTNTADLNTFSYAKLNYKYIDMDKCGFYQRSSFSCSVGCSTEGEVCIFFNNKSPIAAIVYF